MRFSAPLQVAIYERLVAAPELAAIAGRIHDDAPHADRDDGAEVYVTLGDEVVSPWNTATEIGAVHEVTVAVHGPQRGFLPVKTVAGLITDVIGDTVPALAVGRVVSREFVGARTRREEQGALRRIELKFRFVVEDVAA